MRSFHTIPALAGIVRLYRLTLDYEINKNTAPAYNIAPTVDVPFVTAGDDGNHKLREGRRWLVPWWAKEMPKATMFNARIESIDTSGAFKDAFQWTRCLIPRPMASVNGPNRRPTVARHVQQRHLQGRLVLTHVGSPARLLSGTRSGPSGWNKVGAL